MTVVNMAARRCLCAEVCGENPDCALHGVETQWAIDNTMPTDWQNMVLEYREMHKKQASRIEALEARCERYREALEWIADTKPVPAPGSLCAKRAREALDEV